MPTAAAVCHFLGCLSNWRLVQNDPHYLSICMYIYIYIFIKERWDGLQSPSVIIPYYRISVPDILHMRHTHTEINLVDTCCF